MKLIDLKKMVEQGESQDLEFKTSTGSLSSAMQTVCAFLNSDKGGTIIFGVTDNGKIIGQAVSDKTRKDIALEISKIEPYAMVDIDYVPIEKDLYLIVFVVPFGNKAPYQYDGRSFVRNQSTTMRMTRDEYGDVYNQSNPTLWERLVNNNCTIDDLDHNRIKEVVRMGVFEKRLPEAALTDSILNILIRFNLLVDDKLNNAAVILFCKNESKQFFQSVIRLARFKGIDKREFLDSKQFQANAFDLYDKATDFLHFCLPVAARIEEGNPIRVETPAIPYKVLREALANALVHRDYSYPGGYIAVAVYDDRVNITNYGSLLKGIDLKQLSQEHASHLRNPLIAQVFYACGKIEKWGRGTLDMIEDCKKAGNPLPRYDDQGAYFSITLPLKESIRPINRDISIANNYDLTDRQKNIVAILKNGPLNRYQIMEQMNESLIDRTMQHELTTLKDKGLIASKGRTKATVWYLIAQ